MKITRSLVLFSLLGFMLCLSHPAAADPAKEGMKTGSSSSTSQIPQVMILGTDPVPSVKDAPVPPPAPPEPVPEADLPTTIPAADLPVQNLPEPTIDVFSPDVPGSSNANVKAVSGDPAEVPAADEAATDGAQEAGKNAPPIASMDGATSLGQQDAARQLKSKYITMDFDSVDIQIFIKFIGELTEKNFIMDDRVKGKVTIISPRKISLEEAYKVFESVLDINGFVAIPAGDVIKIIPAPQAREKNVETLLKKTDIVPEDRVVTQIFSLNYASSDEIKKILDPLISKNSVVLSYAPTGMLIITDLLSNIKKLQDIVTVLDVEGVSEQIAFIPVQHAAVDELVKSLTAIFQQQRANMANMKIIADNRTNGVIVAASVADTDRIKKLIGMLDHEMPKGEQSLKAYRLQNAMADDLAKVLSALPKESREGAKNKSPLLSKDVQVVPDKATNTLLITAGRDDYVILEQVIEKLDSPRPMVFIEALIMEVALNKDFRLGVEWRGAKDYTGHISSFDTGSTGAFVGSGGVGPKGPYDLFPTIDKGIISNLPGGFSMGVLGAGIKIGDLIFPSIGAVLQTYQTDSDVSILSAPQILTVDNEEAEINVGKNVPYMTRQEKNTTGVDYSSYEYKDVGVNLKVTPNINELGFVRLKIDQQVTKVLKDESAVGLPTTLKRTAKTTVVIKNGETVVIGGLIGDSTEKSTYRIPLLGSIPGLGWLFKTMSKGREKSNLYVFLTPHIIRTHEEMKVISDQKRNEMGEIKEGVIRLNEKKQVH